MSLFFVSLLLKRKANSEDMSMCHRLSPNFTLINERIQGNQLISIPPEIRKIWRQALQWGLLPFQKWIIQPWL